MFHGTGDIFASTCVGAMARGLDWKQALRLAADYTAQCIRVTLDDPTRPWYGVDFELALPYLIDRLKKALQTSPPIAHCARPQNLTPQQISPPPTPVRAILTAKNKKASQRLRRARRK